MLVRSVFFISLLTLNAIARADDSWVGQKVMPKRHPSEIKFSDRVDGKEVDLKLRAAIVAVLSEEKGQLRIWDTGREGYVDKADFVLLIDAPAFYGELIRKDADDPFARPFRGLALSEIGEWDKAIKDFNELIRVEPQDAWALNARGNAWLGKKEYDRAIKDFDERSTRKTLVPSLAAPPRGISRWTTIEQSRIATKPYGSNRIAQALSTTVG